MRILDNCSDNNDFFLGGVKVSRNKIIYSFCKEEFYSLQRFYAHTRVCEKRKNWRDKRKCWETDLQGGKKKEVEL